MIPSKGGWLQTTAAGPEGAGMKGVHLAENLAETPVNPTAILYMPDLHVFMLL